MQFSRMIRTCFCRLIGTLLLAGAFVPGSQAQFLDNFNYANNAALEAVWGAPVVGGQTATAFTYNTGSGKLNGTGLTDADVGGYGTSIFSRPVSFSGDFVAGMDFDWNQSLALGTMFMELRSATGVIASGGLGDDTGSPGHAYMQVGGNSTYLGANGAYIGGATSFETQTGAIATSFNNAPIVSAAADAVRTGNALGNVGSGRLGIFRFDDQIRALITRGTDQFSLGPVTASADDIASINLVFAGFAFGANANHLTGDTGTHVAIDRFSLEAPHGPGDANGVGGVTIDDYLLIRANSFTSQFFGTNGDTNYDGFVDFEDFREWKSNFPGGAAAAEAAIAALGVPEPASIVLCGSTALILLLAVGRRLNR